VGASWVTQGPDIGEIALRFGADDFGSVMFEENVVSSAGNPYCIDRGRERERSERQAFGRSGATFATDWLTDPA